MKLKGVNKRVIEVQCTENDYIERAILFVHADREGTDRKSLLDEAQKYLSQISIPGKPRRKPSPPWKALAGFLAGVLLSALVFLFLS